MEFYFFTFSRRLFLRVIVANLWRSVNHTAHHCSQGSNSWRSDFNPLALIFTSRNKRWRYCRSPPPFFPSQIVLWDHSFILLFFTFSFFSTAEISIIFIHRCRLHNACSNSSSEGFARPLRVQFSFCVLCLCAWNFVRFCKNTVVLHVRRMYPYSLKVDTKPTLHCLHRSWPVKILSTPDFKIIMRF